ncbi:AsmA family protein [Falsiruegeria litorea R37]|uniref:AsmA family protein n=1 Tax=Falsiruegeria litorea R37 TaxID=1200284 RepID=A0A1Y5SN44_9RHOB|nr:AsmA family protein [Falsiruegeria litorea]SLN42840.1 AsmA family protein [Falsiruegeria litorea R37]
MLQILYRFSLWLVIVSAIVFALLWMVLASSLFSGFRKDLVGDILSEQMGQPVVINGDVSLNPGPVSEILVSGVEIPSEDIPEINLAELSLLELELDLLLLAQGELEFDNLIVDGLGVDLVHLADGRKSWSERETAGINNREETPEEQERGGILEFLSDKTVAFSNISLTRENETTGFTFDFQIDVLSLTQEQDGKLKLVTGKGDVNGQDFLIDAQFPSGADFTTRASFGDVELTFDGTPIPLDQGGGYTAELTLDTGSFADFLQVLQLDPVLDGTGTFSAKMLNQGGKLQILDTQTIIDLSEGQRLEASGSIADFRLGDDINIKLAARLHPEGARPPTAREIADLKLTAARVELVGDRGELELREMYFETNAFEQGLDSLGPVSLGNFGRTEDGTLAIRDISIQAGPLDAPYLKSQGHINNLLELKDLAFAGDLMAPASLLLGELGPEVADQFGRISANFEVDDEPGHLRLVEFQASAQDTDLWALDTYAKTGNVLELGQAQFHLDLDIPETRTFLEALNLEPVDAGPLELLLDIKGKDDALSMNAQAAIDSSRLETQLDVRPNEGAPFVRGEISSEKLDLKDLQQGVAAFVQLDKLIEDGPGQGDVQPLVLPKEPEDDDVQPLVLPEGQKFVDMERRLRETDLEILVNIAQIVGQQGISKVESSLTLKEGKADLGPLELQYGGGYFRASAGMDLLEAPERLTVSGATSGWDFGKILDAVGLGIQAHGTLRGDFNVSGNRTSLKTFINTMSGRATISMRDGDIATSLIELAGLGIFPWLFSGELQQGYTDIVCAVAPLRIAPGKITSESVVVETKSVQLVAAGGVDWRNDAIALRAEPRPVGRPLARSAWPFSVSGKLSKPDFKLHVGGVRSQEQGNRQVQTERTPCKPDRLQ